MPPDARPMIVGRMLVAPVAPGLNDITTTPTVAMMIAAIIGTVTASPRNSSPKIATCTGSVLM